MRGAFSAFTGTMACSSMDANRCLVPVNASFIATLDASRVSPVRVTRSRVPEQVDKGATRDAFNLKLAPDLDVVCIHS